MHDQFGKNISRSQPRRCRDLILGILFLGFSATLCAQQTSGHAASETDLPEAPGRESLSPQLLDPQSTASISGIILDINEGIVPDAKVILETQSGQAERVTAADSTGFFSFFNLPAGTFKLRITAPGLEPFESNEITLHIGEKYQFPKIALPIAAASVSVTVTATEEQVAQEQVIAEIQQRVFGIFPNFYTSYLWDAAPLNPKQKFHLAIRAAVDPVTFLTTGMLSGIQQALNVYPAYGQGAEGYAKRYGADFGDLFIGRMIGAAVLPSLLHQDPRYFYQGTGSIRSRAWHALSAAFVCRGDNGRSQFNYSHILGNLAAGGISNFYRPDANRGFLLVVDNALLHTAANASGNLVREFALRKVTTKVPSYAKGKEQPVAESPKP
jgi:Carboxypeptidase regulatory-like domain